MKPDYCTNPNVATCIMCNLVNYGLDCHNNPIATTSDPQSKYQQIYTALHQLVQSEKTPHLDALEDHHLLDVLTVDQAMTIVQLMQTAYRNGQAAQGSEKIDSDAVWVNGVGAIERQPDGSWKLTMPDKGVDRSLAASAMGAATGGKKAETARENGKRGGRPRKKTE